MKKVFASILFVMLMVTTCGIAEQSIPIKKIVLSDKSVTLAVNTTWELAAEITPDDATDKTILWTSSNDKVATVDDHGIITGIEKGTAKITATSSDGKAKAQATVKVNEYDLVFTDTEPQSDKYYYKSGSFTVKGRVKKGCVVIDLLDTQVFSMSSGKTLLASDPFNVTPVAQGEDVITVTAGKQKTTITVYVSQKVGRELDAQRAEKEKELAEKAERAILYSGFYEYVKSLFTSKDKVLGLGKPQMYAPDDWPIEKIRLTYIDGFCQIALVGYNKSGYVESSFWRNITEKRAITVFCALCEKWDDLHSKLLDDQELEMTIYADNKAWNIQDAQIAAEFLQKYKK